MFVLLVLILAGCGGAAPTPEVAQPTQAPAQATEAVLEPTTEPTQTPLPAPTDSLGADCHPANADGRARRRRAKAN